MRLQSRRMKDQEGLSPRRVLYMERRGQGAIPLTRTDENFWTPFRLNKKLPSWPISCVYQFQSFSTK